MKPSSFQRLVRLNLSSEQMVEVMAVVAEELAPLERMRQSAVQRQATLRAKRVSHETDLSRLSNVTPCVAKERVSPAPLPKENTSTLTGFGVRGRAREGDQDRFDDFWATYPKREGNRDRKAAQKAFSASLRRSSADEIIQGAARYAAHCDATGKTNTQFVRQARTWLNADGWNEEYGHDQQHRAGGIIDKFLNG